MKTFGDFLQSITSQATTPADFASLRARVPDPSLVAEDAVAELVQFVVSQLDASQSSCSDPEFLDYSRVVLARLAVSNAPLATRLCERLKVFALTPEMQSRVLSTLSHCYLRCGLSLDSAIAASSARDAMDNQEPPEATTTAATVNLFGALVTLGESELALSLMNDIDLNLVDRELTCALLVNASMASARIGQYDVALRHASHAVKLVGPSPVSLNFASTAIAAHRQLMQLQLHAQDQVAAKRSFDQLLAIAPNFDRYRDEIEYCRIYWALMGPEKAHSHTLRSDAIRLAEQANSPSLRVDAWGIVVELARRAKDVDSPTIFSRALLTIRDERIATYGILCEILCDPLRPAATGDVRTRLTNVALQFSGASGRQRRCVAAHFLREFLQDHQCAKGAIDDATCAGFLGAIGYTPLPWWVAPNAKSYAVEKKLNVGYRTRAVDLLERHFAEPLVGCIAILRAFDEKRSSEAIPQDTDQFDGGGTDAVALMHYLSCVEALVANLFAQSRSRWEDGSIHEAIEEFQREVDDGQSRRAADKVANWARHRISVMGESGFYRWLTASSQTQWDVLRSRLDNGYADAF